MQQKCNAGISRLRPWRISLQCAALACACQFIASAQIQNLSTVNDGSAIYFETRLRPHGSSELPYPKVYRLDKAGFHLVAAAPFPAGALATGGWWVESASVSGDGNVVAVNSANPCSFGTACVDITQEFTEFLIGAAPQRYRGRAQVSRSGRYALLYRATGFGAIPQAGDLPVKGVSLLDLQTGSLTPRGDMPATYGQWISAAGVTLVGIDTWSLVGPSGIRQSLGPAPTALRAVIADDASFVVYQVAPSRTAVPAISELRIRQADGSDTTLAPLGSFPSISADGARILYVAPVQSQLQAVLFDRRSSTTTPVSAEPEGVNEAVISGNGNLAVLTTALGKLVTMEIPAGTRTEYIGQVPDLGPIPLDAFSQPAPIRSAEVPGSLYSIVGQHLATQFETPPFPLPTERDGVQVLVGGVPAALAQIGPNQINYQVAWETPLTPASNQQSAAAEVVLRSGDPGWEAVIPIEKVSAFLPQIIPVGTETVTTPFKHDNTLYAIHGDWHGPVTSKDPAVVGEYVNFYATGLGPVAPPVATGAPSPADPPAAITTPCVWSISTDATGTVRLEVAYAGLAPGYAGIYQITVKVPRGATSGQFTPFCR